MNIKIHKLYIKNFKVYKEKLFLFEGTDLIVFDGPNGFGKTTIYDAIELLFTGSIRRYKSISNIVDRRETQFENPLYYENGDGSPILIKALVEFENEFYTLARANSEIKKAELNFDDFHLYIPDSFESELITKVSEENLKKILGENYKNDFEFINYVEQEDTFYYLKSSERQKKSDIEYLFKTGDFATKIEKFRKINDALRKCISGADGLESQILTLQSTIEDLKNSRKKVANITYNPLFPSKNFEWDKEEINFDFLFYTDVIGSEESLLFRLENFIRKREEFIKYWKNKTINSLLENNNLLNSFFYYEFHRDKYNRLIEERDLYISIIQFLELLKNFVIENIKSGFYFIPEKIKRDILEPSVSEEFDKKINTLEKVYRNANSAAQIYSKLLSSNQTLTSHLREYHREIEENGICPLCGFDWSTGAELYQNIEVQKKELEILNTNLDQELAEQVQDFREFINVEILSALENHLKGLSYTPDYFGDDFFNTSLTNTHSKLRTWFQEIAFDFPAYISNNLKEKNAKQFDLFLAALRSERLQYNESEISFYFDELFFEFFNSNLEELNKITVTNVQEKKQYIEWQYSLNQNIVLLEKNNQLETLLQQNEKLVQYQQKTNRTLNILKDSLKWYNSELIKDIELLFHIYSGRIMQDFHGGLGLFIVSKGDKIKFVSSPKKSYDAIFSMSTGQLSALVLAFTLALNKKYSKTKLILIDDPVQSMDDINTAGFVEVLRNDFSDRQIFLSTHEHMMSTYVRYKFKKFEIDSKRFDLSNDTD